METDKISELELKKEGPPPIFSKLEKGDTPTVGVLRKGCAPQNRIKESILKNAFPYHKPTARAGGRVLRGHTDKDLALALTPTPNTASSAPRARTPGPAPSGGADWPRPPSLLRAALGIGHHSHARHALSSGPRASLRAGRDRPGGERGRAGDRSSGSVRHRPRPHSARPTPARPYPASASRLRLAAPHRELTSQPRSGCAAPGPTDRRTLRAAHHVTLGTRPAYPPPPTHTHPRHHRVTQLPSCPALGPAQPDHRGDGS